MLIIVRIIIIKNLYENKSIDYKILKDKDYINIFKNTIIYNNSFEYIFDNYNDDNNFMFLDPPYDCNFTDYGYCKFEKE